MSLIMYERVASAVYSLPQVGKAVSSEGKAVSMAVQHWKVIAVYERSAQAI
jgi:hypothetical protein